MKRGHIYFQDMTQRGKVDRGFLAKGTDGAVCLKIQTSPFFDAYFKRKKDELFGSRCASR